MKKEEKENTGLLSKVVALGAVAVVGATQASAAIFTDRCSNRHDRVYVNGGCCWRFIPSYKRCAKSIRTFKRCLNRWGVSPLL